MPETEAEAAAEGGGVSTLESELDELQRRYRMMEADRKLYADEVQNVVRKQKAQIEKLKRENAQLKGELTLQQRASSVGDGSVASVKMTRMQDATDQITRAIELERRRSEELDARTRVVREGILGERRDMGGNNAPQEQNQAIGKQIKVLEHRLHRALVKFNEAIAANKDLREEIDNLRRERVVFDGIYKKLQHELAEKKKRMAEIIEVANVAYEQRDRAQTEISQLKLQAEKEQQEFENEWKELGRKLEEDKKRQDFLQRERQKMMEVGGQRGEMSIEDETVLKKSVVKGHWGLAKDKASIHAGMEKVQSYEEAFTQIQKATQISDIDTLVQQFIENEDQNFKMFNYLNELNQEIERSEESIVELKQETEKYRGQDKGAASQRKRLIKDLQERTKDVEERTVAYEDAYKVLTASIGAISRSIEGLATKLRCSTQLLSEMGADSGCTEGNIMIYLGIVEQRANELLSAYLSLQQHGHVGGGDGGSLGHSASAASGMLAGPNTPAGMSTVSITVPTTGDDFESDDSEEDDEHPLTRDELHAKTMRGLAKREASTARKGKVGGAAKRR
jgi:chromosome segregation ATPase